MKIFLSIILSFMFYQSFAQSIDTFSNALSYTNTFLPVTNFNGVTTNGHVYGIGFKLNFDWNGAALNMDATRIDFTTKQATYKTMPGSYSNTGTLWRHAFDSTGSFYIVTANGIRSIWRFNFKDSIWQKNLGNGFMGNNNTLAYSMGLGRNNNMYFGGSSADQSTVWSEYDPYLDTMYKHPEIDAFQDYVLFILGDSLWTYAQVGQRSYNYLWAIRKSDNYQKKLDSVPSSTIWGGGVKTGGILVSKGGTSDNFYLHDTTMTTTIPANIGSDVFYFEVNDGITYYNPTFHNVSSYYNPATSKFSYTVDNDTGSTLISSTNIVSGTGLVFTDQADTNSVYFAGINYGTWSKYNIQNSTTTQLGLPGFNVYSWLQYDDSIFYFSGYPSGVLVKYNKNKAWTAETFDVSMRHLSSSTNPKLVTYLRNYGGFHHGYYIKRIGNLIVVQGDVIRTGNNTCSIAVYNVDTDSTYGYDHFKVEDGLGSAGLAIWRDKIIMSTNNGWGGTPKIYIYNPITNTMEDSINLGFTDYGKVYVIGDKLLGVANNVIYNYNLADRVLVNSHSYATNAITYNSMMPDGRILIKSTGITLPIDMSATFVSYPYSTSYGATNYSNTYIYTTNSLGSLSRLNNYYSSDAGLLTPEKRRIFTLRKLNLIP